jgi:hypothetical protein
MILLVFDLADKVLLTMKKRTLSRRTKKALRVPTWLEITLRFGKRDWPYVMERVRETALPLGNPPLYFARYGPDRGNVVVKMYTSLRPEAVCQAFPTRFRAKAKEIGSASAEHAKAFELAAMLRGKSPHLVMDVVHWLFNMLSFNYIQEARCHAELLASYLQSVERPNEPKLPTVLKPKTKPDEQKHPARRRSA